MSILKRLGKIVSAEIEDQLLRPSKKSHKIDSEKIYNEFSQAHANLKEEKIFEKPESKPENPENRATMNQNRLEKYYAHLEVPLQASFEEVKKSYRRLLLKYHPDQHQDSEKKKIAEEITRTLHESFKAIEKELNHGN